MTTSTHCFSSFGPSTSESLLEILPSLAILESLVTFDKFLELFTLFRSFVDFSEDLSEVSLLSILLFVGLVTLESFVGVLGWFGDLHPSSGLRSAVGLLSPRLPVEKIVF